MNPVFAAFDDLPTPEMRFLSADRKILTNLDLMLLEVSGPEEIFSSPVSLEISVSPDRRLKYATEW